MPTRGMLKPAQVLASFAASGQVNADSKSYVLVNTRKSWKYRPRMQMLLKLSLSKLQLRVYQFSEGSGVIFHSLREVFPDEASCHFSLFESQWSNRVRCKMLCAWSVMALFHLCKVMQGQGGFCWVFSPPFPKGIPKFLSMKKGKEHSPKNNLFHKNKDSYSI